ncbi:GNAT family N-acetyltransferase [Streptomyces sp. SKN60]|uniref:GNAT family N-acetyltransferase n=1 Tax=Streptomyces sp. SKN60 TaxID=2855506 RepID=UPI00224524EB|nr:GNAT family N-acetyltransferase [Streptomyces sp. SKN60]MCX2180426.1 GNAT family N-acetyltransferase [Streptomyces sp. SKN60]
MNAFDPAHFAAVPLRGPRLDLEPLRLDHAAETAPALADPALHVFIGGAPLTGPELTARYARLLAGPPDPATTVWCNWVLRLRETGAAIGTVQATVAAGGAELAWVLGTPWQGRGLAREAAVVLADWLRERGAPALVAHVHPEHRASAAVAAAAGLAPTEVFEDGERRWEWRTLRAPN